MIESCYWKDELRRIANSLRRVSNPSRWSERAHCIIERDIMIGFFVLRRLIELNKVSSLTRNSHLRIFSYVTTGKSVTRLNNHRLDELYDLEHERASEKKPFYIANQFVHAFTSFVARDNTRNWSDVFVVSDFDRNDCIWRVPVAEIRRVFQLAAGDYPHSVQMVWNSKTTDYDVVTN
ncbi:MAG: hypothetical protein BIFFINMI_02475 [Phycisphaerae bacterium]|nr:hypothetical protein [Phycisphaerae bacterium]